MPRPVAATEIFRKADVEVRPNRDTALPGGVVHERTMLSQQLEKVAIHRHG